MLTTLTIGAPERFVLVVDDDAQIRGLLQQALEAEGYRVRVARDGLDAQHQLGPDLPSLTLLDLHMPRMDGFAFAAYLRGHGHPHTPIMVLSGSPQALQRAKQFGAEFYSAKPFDLTVVLDQVARLIAV